MKSPITFGLLLLIFSLGACTRGDVKTEQSAMQTSESLVASSWWVEDIDGKGVVDRSHTTLEFGEDGSVSGDTSCNRYFGNVEITGDEIRFAPLAGTRKACVAALMDQEMRFYQAVDSVVSWNIAETGLLYLRDGKGAIRIRAFRVEP